MIRVNAPVVADGRRTAIRMLLGSAAVLLVVMVAVGAVMLTTVWGHAFDNEAYFGRVLADRHVIALDHRILDFLTPATMIVCLLVLCVVAMFRHILLVGVIAAMGVLSAWAGAELLKHAVAWQPLTPTDDLLASGLRADTYPSGHTTAMTALALATLMILPPRWRSWMAVVAGSVSALFGTGVLFAGWHRPSDAVGGICWAGAVFSVVVIVGVLLRSEEVSSDVGRPFARRRRSGPVVASAIAAVVAFISCWVAAKTAPDGLPDLDAAYLWSVGVIIALAFGATGWLGLVLTRVRWTGERSTFTSYENANS